MNTTLNKTDRNFFIDLKGITILDDPKNGYKLLVDKEIGAWKTVSKEKSRLIHDLHSQGMSFESFKTKYNDDVELLNVLFFAGILRINNRSLVNNKLRGQCDFFPKYPAMVVVNYTRKCNLRCSYCYAYSDGGHSYSMTNEVVLAIMKKLIATYGDKHFHLVLHGGEPTARYKDMVPLLKDIKHLSKNIEVSLQTNATLITKEMAQFFKSENIKVGISIDGFNDKTNNQGLYPNGGSSFKDSLEGLENLYSVNITPGILTVITPSNQYNILDHFDFFVKKGIRRFGYNFFFSAGNGNSTKQNIDTSNLTTVNLELIEKINSINSQQSVIANYVSERGIANLIHNLTSLERNYMCATSPCGSGRKTLAFDTDGSIYPCDDFITQKQFCIGNIFQINDLKKHVEKNEIVHKILEHNVNNIEKCSNCTWKRICTLHCASESFFNQNTFNKPHSMCSFMQSIIPEIIDLLHYNKINPKKFIQC